MSASLSKKVPNCVTLAPAKYTLYITPLAVIFVKILLQRTPKEGF